jgi:ATP adenylyltransferase
MKPLWAPWRMEYILDDKDEGCFLCRAAEAAGDAARKLLLVHKTPSALLVMNRFPYNNGHLLAAPVKHAADLTDLSKDEAAALLEITALAERVLRKTVSPHGFNIGLNIGPVAGAGLPGHVHVHIVPRWQGDTNFMPVAADTKVIPQALETLHKQLIDALSEVI